MRQPWQRTWYTKSKTWLVHAETQGGYCKSVWKTRPDVVRQCVHLRTWLTEMMKTPQPTVPLSKQSRHDYSPDHSDDDMMRKVRKESFARHFSSRGTSLLCQVKQGSQRYWSKTKHELWTISTDPLSITFWMSRQEAKQLSRTSTRPSGNFCDAKQTVDECLHETNEQLHEEHVIHWTIGIHVEDISLHLLVNRAALNIEMTIVMRTPSQDKTKWSVSFGADCFSLMIFPNSINEDASLVISSATHR